MGKPGRPLIVKEDYNSGNIGKNISIPRRSGKSTAQEQKTGKQPASSRHKKGKGTNKKGKRNHKRRTK